MDMDRPVHFTATAEQVPQSQMRFGSILIHVGHAGKTSMADPGLSSIRVIQALEILGVAGHGCSPAAHGRAEPPTSQRRRRWATKPQHSII